MPSTAGATVVAFRPIGYQTNEVVLDNDSRGVKFSGKWFNSRSPIFFGRAGAVPYRFALLDKTESATATYTPRIPAAGFYPVYTWVRHGPDRTSQLYRILHTGGQTLVRVPHHMVGSGWVYLGTYYFEAGADRKRGSVIVSNLQPSPGFGAVAIADAIRFGNGMGDIVPVPGGQVSTYPREEEASWYWILKSLGQGQTNVLSARSSDQGTSNVSAPPRMARAMNRASEGNMFKRIYLGFHSNAGGGRGAIGLWNNPKLFPGTDTPHQQRLAELVGAEVTTTLCGMTVPPLELPWFKRSTVAYARTDYAFGEINNRTIQDDFDATILEVAFHDSRDDAKLLRDPKVRDIAGRCSYQALVRYMNEFDGLPLQFLPEPPRNLRVTSAAEGVSVAWDAPADASHNPVESYLVCRSENGYGFGSPVRVAGNQTSVTLADVPRGKDVYFRVTAVNAGGESLPSAVAGCRPAKKATAPRVLFVNAFTEFARFNNPRQTLRGTNYIMPSAVGKMDRVIPRLNNAFDYVVQHGKALAANGVAFDSCQREAVARRNHPPGQISGRHLGVRQANDGHCERRRAAGPVPLSRAGRKSLCFGLPHCRGLAAVREWFQRPKPAASRQSPPMIPASPSGSSHSCRRKVQSFDATSRAYSAMQASKATSSTPSAGCCRRDPAPRRACSTPKARARPQCSMTAPPEAGRRSASDSPLNASPRPKRARGIWRMSCASSPRLRGAESRSCLRPGVCADGRSSRPSRRIADGPG